MASAVLVRRLVLVTLLMLVRDSAVWIWLTLANNLALAIHLIVLPYERRRDNTLETVTLLSLSVQTTVLSAWPPPYLSAALLSVFNALVIGPLLPLALRGLMLLWVRCRSPNRAQADSGDLEEESQSAEDYIAMQ
jgi:hypothetical protein